MWLLFIVLSTAAWALVNVLNSVVVHNHEKSPVVLTWIQSCMCIPLFIFLGFRLDINSTWIPILIFFGITAYAADLWFFYVIQKIDISVMNVAWSILSLLLSITGFIFFNESWSIMQSVGAVLIIAGVFILTFYHKHLNFKHTLLLLFSLALLSMPYYLVKKVAIDAGQSVSAVFFWMLIGREVFSIILPLFSPSTVRSALETIRLDWKFPVTLFFIVLLYFSAEYLGALAYESGPISLVSIASNIQPFLVMCFAWLVLIINPDRAPKELITKQSVRVKLVSFCIGFIGLSLITVPL